MHTSESWQTVLASASSSQWPEETLGDLLPRPSATVAKRSLDLVLALAGLVVLSPFMLAVAVALKLESSLPALHTSRRLGRNGRVFRCLKFRTMRSDGQVSSVGSVLRRYSLDEIPQLINVLRGDMSVVGPRPVLASDSSIPSSIQDVQRFRRFDIKPGITGLWAMQHPGGAPSRPYISPDETYRSDWSLWLDLTIVMRSVGAALAGK